MSGFRNSVILWRWMLTVASQKIFSQILMQNITSPTKLEQKSNNNQYIFHKKYNREEMEMELFEKLGNHILFHLFKW